MLDSIDSFKRSFLEAIDIEFDYFTQRIKRKQSKLEYENECLKRELKEMKTHLKRLEEKHVCSQYNFNTDIKLEEKNFKKSFKKNLNSIDGTETKYLEDNSNEFNEIIENDDSAETVYSSKSDSFCIESSKETEKSEINFNSKTITMLQKRSFLNKYYNDKLLNDPNFKIDLKNNPINECKWVLIDFKVNEFFSKKNKKERSLINKIGLTKKENVRIRNFYELAKCDRKQTNMSKKLNQNNFFKDFDKTGGLEWNDSNFFEDCQSQMFEKVPSPPGFMKSEFPKPKELIKRKKTILKKQQRRIQRRLKSCFECLKGRQVGEFVFSIDLINKFVQLQRWYVSDNKQAN